MIYVNRPFAAVGDELVVNSYRAELMPLPLAALRPWIFIPVSTT